METGIKQMNLAKITRLKTADLFQPIFKFSHVCIFAFSNKYLQHWMRR